MINHAFFGFIMSCIHGSKVPDIKHLEQAALSNNTEEAMPLYEKEVFRYHTPLLFSASCAPAVREDILINILDNDLLGMLNRKDVEAADALSCQFFGTHIEKMPSNKLKYASFACVQQMITKMTVLQVRHVPPRLIANFAAYFAQMYPRVMYYTPDQLRHLTKNIKACEYLSPLGFERMFERRQWEAVDPICINYCARFCDADIRKQLSEGVIPENFFVQYYGSIQDYAYIFLKPSQINTFGSRPLENFTVVPFPVDLINPEYGFAVRPDQLYNFFWYLQEKNPSYKFGERWKILNDHVIDTFVENLEMHLLVQKIAPSDLQYFSKYQWSRVLECPQSLRSVPSTAIINSKTLIDAGLNSEHFVRMHPKLQATILASPVKLPDNILEHFTYKNVALLPDHIYRLNMIKSKNRKEIIKNCSRKVPEKHICKAITNPAILKDLKIFRVAMPKNCWENLGFKVKVKHILRYPKIFAGRPNTLKIFLKNRRTALELLDLSARQFAILTRGKAGLDCSAMPLSFFRVLDHEKLQALSPTCIASFPHISDGLDGLVQHLSADAFAAFKKDQLHRIPFKLLTTAQLENISSQVDLDETIGAALNRAELEGMIGKERLCNLPARVWKTVPPSAFAIFRDEDYFGMIAGMKMTYWSLEQVKMIPRSVILTIDEEQSSLIGTLSGDERKILDYIANLQTTPRHRQVLGEPQGNSSSPATNISSFLLIMISCTLIFL